MGQLCGSGPAQSRQTGEQLVLRPASGTQQVSVPDERLIEGGALPLCPSFAMLVADSQAEAQGVCHCGHHVTHCKCSSLIIHHQQAMPDIGHKHA